MSQQRCADCPAEQVAAAASRTFAGYWLAECHKIEEQIDRPDARWDLLLRALARIADGSDSPRP